MKSHKIYFIIIGILLLIALSAVGYVWYELQVIKKMSEGVTAPPAVTSGTAPPSSGTASPSSAAPAPIVIHKSDLTASQQKMWDVVGIQGDSFTITSSMRACAEEKLGASRLSEIVGGAAPSLGEAFTLYNCTKQ